MGLVSLGSALIVVAAGLVGGNGDATRAVQGIVTGIGFLGAGVIVKELSSDRIHGLTTAATIWLTAAHEVTCGLGYWVLALVSTGLGFVVLLFGGPLKRPSIAAGRTSQAMARRCHDLSTRTTFSCTSAARAAAFGVLCSHRRDAAASIDSLVFVAR